MRAFVAVEIPELAPVAGLRAASPVAPRHFTLRFLGDVADPTARMVEGALGRASEGGAPFPLTVSGVDAFPNWDHPRVVYARAVEGRRELEAIALAVNDALDEIGIPRDPRPFVPHVTLLRVRSSADAARARELARTVRDRILAATHVEEILLKESELLPSGPRHRTVAHFSLGGVR